MATLHAELLPEGTCVIRAGDVERWRVSLRMGDAAAWSPFREAIVWARAQRVVAGAGERVYVLDLETGAPLATIDLAPDHFGHLAIVELPAEGSTSELLLVLGWTDVHAYALDGSLRWHTRHVAVDGIIFHGLEGSVLHLHAEMDPPGGWFAVSLDAVTGHELARRPAFLPGYVGRYGNAPNDPA